MRSQLTPILLFAGVIAFVGLLTTTSACPDNLQCHNQNECPIGKVCNADAKCVDAVDAGGIDPFDGGPIGGEGEGEGEGEGDVDLTVQVDGPVSMLQTDPRDPSGNTAILGLYDGTGAIDETFGFDLVNGSVIGNNPEFDFVTLAQRGPCNINTITLVSGADVGQNNLPAPDHADELWFDCGDRTDLLYGTSKAAFGTSDNFSGTGPNNNAIGNAEVVRFLLPVEDDNTGTKARIVYAARGEPGLHIIALDPARNPQESVSPAFLTESFDDGTTFEHVTQLFVLRSGDQELGDVMLVFDRKTAGPELIPIQREFGETTWHGAPITNASADFVALPLPTDTHAILFRDDVLVDLTALDIDNTDRNLPTLVALRPTNTTQGAGLVTFARYEAELLVHATAANFGVESHFTDLQLQASDPPALPPATDKLLLETRPDPNDATKIFVFYALTASDHAWKFPIVASQNEDPNIVGADRVLFINQVQDKPNGMVLIPGDLDHAWFSFGAGPNTQEVDRLTFDPDIQ